MKHITRPLVASACLSLWYQAARAQTLPSQVGIQLVFPRDDTYRPAEPFPVVFAFSGASAAWTYGFDFVWRTRRTDGCEGECGVVHSGQLAIEPGMLGGVSSFGDDDAYYLATSSAGMGTRAGYEGGYSLEWEFGFARNCSTAADGGGAVVQSTGGVVSASGRALFRARGDAAPDVRAQLLDNCPLAGGAVDIRANLDGCPELADGTGAKADPCALDVPPDVVNFVVTELAATASSGGSSSSTTSAPASPVSSSATTMTTMSASSAVSPTSMGTSTLPVSSMPSAVTSPSSASATTTSTGSASTASPTTPAPSAAAVVAATSFSNPFNLVLVMFWVLWLRLFGPW